MTIGDFIGLVIFIGFAYGAYKFYQSKKGTRK
jgi:hypothetical protein